MTMNRPIPDETQAWKDKLLALQTADMPNIATKEQKRREAFGREIMKHLEPLMRTLNFKNCDKRMVCDKLYVAVKKLVRKDFHRYAYIAERMVGMFVTRVIAAGSKALKAEEKKRLWRTGDGPERT